MLLETVEQEREFATSLISSTIEQKAADIIEFNLKIKQTKKESRLLIKQLACEHDFKLKQEFTVDHYKCKKCKFVMTNNIINLNYEN